MRKRKKENCEVCGKALTVIINRKTETERLCSRCLVATYPALKELAKIL